MNIVTYTFLKSSVTQLDSFALIYFKDILILIFTFCIAGMTMLSL